MAALAMAAGALLMLLAWWAWPAAHDGVRLLPWQAVAPAGDPAAAAAGVPPAVAAVVAAPAAPANAVPAYWELCGVGLVPVPPGARASGAGVGAFPMLPAPLGGDALAAARSRTLAALRAGDGRSRVAALLWGRLEAPHGADDPAGRAAAVAIALESRDPRVLKWVHEDCQGAGRGACQRALVQAALQLEPDNAAHWARLMADPNEREVAWQGVLRSRHWTDGFGTLIATVQSAIPADVPDYLRMGLLVEAVGMELGMVASFGPAQRCTARPPSAPRAECDRLAHLMVERSDTVLAFAMGRKVAEAAGWPPERLASLEREYADVMRAAQSTGLETSLQPLGCTTVQAMRQRFDALGRVGELQALRDEVARRPR